MEIKYKIKGLMIGPNTRHMKADIIKINNNCLHIERDGDWIETRLEFVYDIEIKK